MIHRLLFGLRLFCLGFFWIGLQFPVVDPDGIPMIGCGFPLPYLRAGPNSLSQIFDFPFFALNLLAWSGLVLAAVYLMPVKFPGRRSNAVLWLLFGGTVCLAVLQLLVHDYYSNSAFYSIPWWSSYDGRLLFPNAYHFGLSCPRP